jgi:hypothetical protein
VEPTSRFLFIYGVSSYPKPSIHLTCFAPQE